MYNNILSKGELNSLKIGDIVYLTIPKNIKKYEKMIAFLRDNKKFHFPLEVLDIYGECIVVPFDIGPGHPKSFEVDKALIYKIEREE